MYQIYEKVDTITEKLTQCSTTTTAIFVQHQQTTSRKMLQKTLAGIKITVFMIVIK